jgi:hypothetical protein
MRCDDESTLSPDFVNDISSSLHLSVRFLILKKNFLNSIKNTSKLQNLVVYLNITNIDFSAKHYLRHLRVKATTNACTYNMNAKNYVKYPNVIQNCVHFCTSAIICLCAYYVRIFKFMRKYHLYENGIKYYMLTITPLALHIESRFFYFELLKKKVELCAAKVEAKLKLSNKLPMVE